MKLPIRFLPALLALFAVGCGSGSTASSRPSLSGTWNVVFTSTDVNAGTTFPGAVTLTQSGTAWAGQFVWAADPGCGNPGQAMGSLSGSTVTLQISQPLGDSVLLTGTINANQAAGTYQLSENVNCVGQAGTWTASR